MPIVEQYDWDKLMPPKRDKSTHGGTKDFKTFEFITPRKNSQHGEIKVTINPLKCSKCDYTPPTRTELNAHWLMDH